MSEWVEHDERTDYQLVIISIFDYTKFVTRVESLADSLEELPEVFETNVEINKNATSAVLQYNWRIYVYKAPRDLTLDILQRRDGFYIRADLDNRYDKEKVFGDYNRDFAYTTNFSNIYKFAKKIIEKMDEKL
jgi:hypothetical protein